MKAGDYIYGVERTFGGTLRLNKVQIKSVGQKQIITHDRNWGYGLNCTTRHDINRVFSTPAAAIAGYRDKVTRTIASMRTQLIDEQTILCAIDELAAQHVVS